MFRASQVIRMRAKQADQHIKAYERSKTKVTSEVAKKVEERTYVLMSPFFKLFQLLFQIFGSSTISPRLHLSRVAKPTACCDEPVDWYP